MHHGRRVRRCLGRRYKGSEIPAYATYTMGYNLVFIRLIYQNAHLRDNSQHCIPKHGELHTIQ